MNKSVLVFLFALVVTYILVADAIERFYPGPRLLLVPTEDVPCRQQMDSMGRMIDSMKSEVLKLYLHSSGKKLNTSFRVVDTTPVK